MWSQSRDPLEPRKQDTRVWYTVWDPSEAGHRGGKPWGTFPGGHRRGAAWATTFSAYVCAFIFISPIASE